ncbi:hypothetical protein DRE_02720 [Drechslerella stenobrocha 248]|uniref:Peptidase C14 caspase domain-containing protein n=1 Tax=Drechslerella stenobrocha 248 TaxID=1043628 RepID=W7I6J8_9PEZI|nr:hypothetical protein DRE_02720 [Drechslerella stenobrocha 248]
MAKLLDLYGFSPECIKICNGERATRVGILQEWGDLNDRIQSLDNDPVILYYSGHGGLVQPITTEDLSAGLSPRQFIVPIDYNPSALEFSGVLDVELNHLLQGTTSKTANVTIILDCCHSGSMTRDPSLGDNAVQKSLDAIQYHSLVQHRDQHRLKYGGSSRDDPESNQDAVRIVAGTTDEKAWEYKVGTVWGGALTRALVRVLREAHEQGLRVPWRTTMARVRELVKLDIPTQHPHVEGPWSRLHFDTEVINDTGLSVSKVAGAVYINAGHLEQVYDGNEYSILPYGSTCFSEETEIARATVQKVVGFKAKVLLSPNVPIPGEGAVAFLRKLSLPKLPALISAGIPKAVREALEEEITTSKYLEVPNDNNPFVEFGYDDAESRIVLYDRHNVEIMSQQVPRSDNNSISATTFHGIFEQAEQMARAQHLVALKSLVSKTAMTTNLSIGIDAVENNETVRQINTDGTGQYYPEDRLCISLKNNGGERFYVSVFNVNVAGNIALVSHSHGAGINLEAGEEYEVGKDEFDDRVGLRISWPKGVPKLQPVVESLVLIKTDQPVALQHLEGSAGRNTDNEGSLLAQLTDILESGGSRDWGRAVSSSFTRYQIQVIKFTLGLERPTRGESIVDADSWEEHGGLQDRASGLFSLLQRNSNPFIWIINRHSEEITVVVSQYGPNRQLSEAGLEGSATGGGFNLAFTYWDGPATKKTLKPYSQGLKGAIGKFPVWKKRRGCGVITIFVGNQKTLFIENDLVQAGVLANFTGDPNLEVEPFDPTVVEGIGLATR